MANDWLNLDAQLPWLERQAKERDALSSQVLAAMQFGAQVKQRNFQNNLQLMDFGLRAQAQELQNKSTLLRIQEAQNSLNDQENDHPIMAGFLDSLRNETDLDSLRSMGLPTFNDPRNLAVANTALTQRINQLSGITAERMLADTRAYNLKRLDGFDPDLRQEAMAYLNPKTGLFEEGANDVLNQLEQEQEKRGLEKKAAESEIIKERQVAVAEIRAKAIRDRVNKEPSLDQALMRHTGTVMRQENLNYSDAQDTIRAEWNSAHGTVGGASGATTEAPISRKITPADEVRLKDLNEDEKRLQVRIDKMDDELVGLPPDDKTTKLRITKKQELEQKLKEIGFTKNGILQKYEPAEKRMGMGDLHTAEQDMNNRVRVQKNGAIGTIPKAQLDQALKEGYSLVP